MMEVHSSFMENAPISIPITLLLRRLYWTILDDDNILPNPMNFMTA